MFRRLCWFTIFQKCNNSKNNWKIWSKKSKIFCWKTPLTSMILKSKLSMIRLPQTNKTWSRLNRIVWLILKNSQDTRLSVSLRKKIRFVSLKKTNTAHSAVSLTSLVMENLTNTMKLYIWKTVTCTLSKLPSLMMLIGNLRMSALEIESLQESAHSFYGCFWLE